MHVDTQILYMHNLLQLFDHVNKLCAKKIIVPMYVCISRDGCYLWAQSREFITRLPCVQKCIDPNSTWVSQNQTRYGEFGRPICSKSIQNSIVKSHLSEDWSGHVPRNLSRLIWHFLQHDGKIMCEITSSRRQSLLVQGGLELPCTYKFVGKKESI